MAYIEQEKVISKLKNSPEQEHIEYMGIYDCIKSVPTADMVEVRHGKWDINRNCSICGVYKFEGLDADVWADWDIDYCPHCGAKMDGKDGE